MTKPSASREDSPSKDPLRPLEGVRVLDLGVWHAGPGAGAILGDLGADVIKVESLTGDPERRNGAFGILQGNVRLERPDWNILFEMSNRNKRSISLDLSNPSGLAIFERLVQDADVFLTNLRPPTRVQLGIDYERLSTLKPDLVYVNVSAFGPEGPYATRGGFDTMGQALSGMMFITNDEEPQALQLILLDQMTAIAASHATLTALLVRELHGGGQEVHASLVGSAVWLMHANLWATELATGPFSFAWDRTTASPLRTTYKCSDDRWIMGTNHPPERYWPNLCQAMGRQDLLTDPRFDTPEKRKAGSRELTAAVDQVFALKTREEWLQILEEHGLLFAPINTLRDALSDPQLVENSYIEEFEQRYLGKVRVPGYPITFSRFKAGTHASAPEQGEHTAEILTEAGYDADEIEAFAKADVIVVPETVDASFGTV